MVSALDSGSGGAGSSTGLGTALCSWARHVTLILPLSSQVYKRVPANLLLGVTCDGLASLPGESMNTLSDRDKLRIPTFFCFFCVLQWPLACLCVHFNTISVRKRVKVRKHCSVVLVSQIATAGADCFIFIHDLTLLFMFQRVIGSCKK